MLSVRSRPAVVTHKEHAIVAGGRKRDFDGTIISQNDNEVLNWTENIQWNKVSTKLPVPMWDFTPTILEDHLFIVGYSNGIGYCYIDTYKIPVNDIFTLASQQIINDTARWTILASSTNWATAIIPGSSLPVVVGGDEAANKPVTNIEMYNGSIDSWKYINWHIVIS